MAIKRGPSTAAQHAEFSVLGKTQFLPGVLKFVN